MAQVECCFNTRWAGSHTELDLGIGECYEAGVMVEYAYSITVYFEQPAKGFVAIETIKSIVEGGLAAVPTKPLPKHLSTLEGLATWIATLHTSITKVFVYEPAEKIGALWRR